jgi:hypothetical protein
LLSLAFFDFFQVATLGTKDLCARTGDVAGINQMCGRYFGVPGNSAGRVFRHLQGQTAFDYFDFLARNRHFDLAFQHEINPPRALGLEGFAGSMKRTCEPAQPSDF